MNIMRLAAIAVTVPCALALGMEDKAKPEEAALRAQVEKFYQLEAEGKHRVAEQLVCEASRDEYYSSPKQTSQSHAVQSLKLAPDGKSADAIVALDSEFAFQGTKKTVKVPIPTHWLKSKQGWCLDAHQGGADDLMAAAFGKPKIKQEQQVPGATAPVPPEKVAVMPAAAAARKVAFSKQRFQLVPGKDGKDEITITNGLDGPVWVDNLVCPEGGEFTCALSDKNVAPAGGQATLSLVYRPQGKPWREKRYVTIWIQPFRREVNFEIVPR